MELTILDLGGVLYNINFERTRTALAQLSGYNGKPIFFGTNDQDVVFVRYDRGDISTQEFRAELRRIFGFTCTDHEIDAAWCAILRDGLFDFAEESVLRVRNYFNTHEHNRLVLFSNISELHYSYCKDICAAVFGMVDKTYFSFIERVRKPDTEAFLHVCRLEGALPEHSTLIDDSSANCAAALSLGMRVVHVTNPQMLLDLGGQ